MPMFGKITLACSLSVAVVQYLMVIIRRTDLRDKPPGAMKTPPPQTSENSTIKSALNTFRWRVASKAAALRPHQAKFMQLLAVWSTMPLFAMVKWVSASKAGGVDLSGIDDDTVAEFAENMGDEMTKLDLAGCKRLTDDALFSLQEKCSSLTKLDLGSLNVGITVSGILDLITDNATTLDLAGLDHPRCKDGDSMLMEWLKEEPFVEQLDLQSLGTLADSTLVAVADGLGRTLRLGGLQLDWASFCNWKGHGSNVDTFWLELRVAEFVTEFEASRIAAPTPTSVVDDGAVRQESTTAATQQMASAATRANLAKARVVVREGRNMEALDEELGEANERAAVLRLMSAGADSRVALMLASQSGKIDSALALLDTGAEWEVDEEYNKMTALIHASHSGKTETALALLDWGVDLNATDGSGKTALMYASSGMTVDLNATDGSGRKAIGSETTVALLDRGADMNVIDGAGKTALMYAIEKDRTETADALRKAGASA
jgi:hypothetical protein